MRILVLQDDFPPEVKGGAAVIAAALTRELASRGHELVVITTTQDPKNVGTNTWEGATVHRIYAPAYHERWRAYHSIHSVSVVREIAHLMHEMRPDIVHAHNIHTYLSYASLNIAKRHGARVFLTAHDTMLFAYGKVNTVSQTSTWKQIQEQRFRFNPTRQFYIRRAIRDITLISVSEALADALTRNGFHSAAIIHNGIDLNEWRIDPNAVANIKRKYGLAGKKVILFGGRISAAKGSKEARAMLERVRDRVPSTELLVVGSGKLEGAYNTGWLSREEMPAVYGASDVVIVPSIYLDPFPTANLEAMASRKPVVATCFGGSHEAVADGETGFIVDPHDTATFANRVVTLLNNSSIADTLGNAGYLRVKNQFSIGQFANQYLSIYQSAPPVFSLVARKKRA